MSLHVCPQIYFSIGFGSMNGYYLICLYYLNSRFENINYIFSFIGINQVWKLDYLQYFERFSSKHLPNNAVIVKEVCQKCPISIILCKNNGHKINTQNFSWITAENCRKFNFNGSESVIKPVNKMSDENEKSCYQLI